MRRVRRAVARFWGKGYEDNLTGLAAMVAYSLLLSLFPVALIALFVAGRVLRSEEVTQSVLNDLQRLFPSATEADLRSALRSVRSSSTTAGVLALVGSAWVATSFWGALDTAFCRIYHLPCRSWVRQKVFALGMLVVVLAFFAASVAIPAIQGLWAASAHDLPLGLNHVEGLVYAVSLAASLVLLFAILCLIYWRVPKGAIPWTCVWPGALVATLAMALVDWGFPLYLAEASTLRSVKGVVVFVLIALVWCWALSLILLAGAVVNELRFEDRRDGRFSLSAFEQRERVRSSPP
jgi:YihY family inner membrane protein